MIVEIEVARRYEFLGRHSVPGLPEPWRSPHDHRYTVEVVARGESPIVVDTDEIDRAWESIGPASSDPRVRWDFDELFGEHFLTTVEQLAEHWLGGMIAAVGPVIVEVSAQRTS
jgi:6-pyruvoyl-tetrahydropterin synthase